MTETDEDKVNELNTYFISVFTHEQGPPPTIGQRAFTSALSDIQISLEDITLRLKKMNPNKAPGPDNQHPCVFRELYDILDVPLLLIFRKSLEEGCLPESWKQAKITPIHKKGSRSLSSNYRPISLTSIVCKTMESIIRKHIMQHMESNSFFSEHQHGFLPGRSTVTQLLEVLDNWFSFYDEHTCVDAIYLDFSKAFDSVPHARLIAQLESYGITGKVISWITGFLNNGKQAVCVNGTESYGITGKVISWITGFLNNGKQAVCVNGTVSKWAKVMSGVPQGSVLGPVLFIIYISSLPDSVTNHIKLFADDSKLWAPVKTIEDCEALQNDIPQLHEWADTCQLNFNEKKCTVLRVGKNSPSYTYTMTNHTGQTVKLEETTCEKGLGVWIDNELSFKTPRSISIQKSKLNTRSHTKIL